MAFLDRLSIQGLRSFGHTDDDKQIITFTRKFVSVDQTTGSPTGEVEVKANPCTLILGKNGCGKTTIIECLRYVCSGDVPPGSGRGASFVHDPKMAKETRVTGNAKMQFYGVDSKLALVSRTITATQNPKTITVKTLDSSLRLKDGDRLVDVSSRCTNINELMLMHLGVSKSILNYVVFCHQEDSNWPLDEGGKVKERFDEIFDTLKYKKYMEEIKKVRQSHMDQIRTERVQLNHYSELHALAQGKKRDLDRKQVNKTEAQSEKQQAETDLRPLREQLKALDERSATFSGLVEKKSEAEAEKRNAEKNIEEIKEYIRDELLEQSDAQLKHSLRNVDCEAEVDRQRLIEAKNELQGVNDELKTNEGELRVKSAKIGECYAKENANGEVEKKLKAIMQEAKAQLGLSQNVDAIVCADSLDGERKKIEEVCFEVQKVVVSHDRRLKATEVEADKMIEAKNNNIMSKEKELARCEEKNQQVTNDITEKGKELNELKNKQRKAEQSTSRLLQLDSSLKDLQAKLETNKAAFDAEASKLEVHNTKGRLRQLESEEALLKQERKAAESNLKALSELTLKQDEKEQKNSKMLRLLSKWQQEMEEKLNLTSDGDELSSLRSRFDDINESFNAEKKICDSKLQGLKDEKSVKKERLQTMQSEAAEKRRKADKLRSSIQSRVSVGLGDLDSELSETKQGIEKTRRDLQIKEAIKHTNSDLIDKLDYSIKKQTASCPTCHRHFDNVSEAQELRKDLKRDMEAVPNKVRHIETTLKALVEKEQTLTKASHDKIKHDELNDEAETGLRECQKLEKQLRQLEVSISSAEKDSNLLQSQVSFCSEIRDDIITIDHLCSETSRLSLELSNLSVDSHSSKSMDELNSQSDQLSQDIRQLRTNIEQKQEQLVQHEQERNKLEREINLVRQSKFDIEKQQQEALNCGQLIAKLEQSIDTLKAQKLELQKSIEALKRAKKELESQSNDLRKDKAKNVESQRIILEKAKQFNHNLQSLAESLQDYFSSGNKRAIEHLMDEIADLKSQSEMKKDRRSTLEEEIASLQKTLSQGDERKRELTDNLRLRGYKNDLEKFKNEVEKCERSLRLFDYDAVARERSALITQMAQHERNISKLEGKMAELSDTISEMERELNNPKLAGAQRSYSELNIKLRCRQHVVDDLNKVYKAVDWAMMRFHRSRMAYINRIIRELWRAIYKGNDIDYIEIDADEPDPNLSADRRRSYNYRVMMLKNGTAMEMRGRCSAGQKNLASLIIRLALAETFSSKCGVIALDEPTTNLDRGSIESLAEALALIVERHSSRNKCFQLIVITHDSEFIETLGRNVQELSHYWKVSRNQQGLSVIKKCPITDL